MSKSQRGLLGMATPVLAAALGLLLLPSSAWANNRMSGNSYYLFPGSDNAGGREDESSATDYRLSEAVGEAVVAPRMSSLLLYQMGTGLKQIMSYPNVIIDLAVAGTSTGTANMTWTSPGYDGFNGALQSGTSYYVVVTTYTAPDPFFLNNFTLTVATSATAPGTQVSLPLTGLLDNTTYFVHVWTRDADGNASFISSRSTFTTLVGLIAGFVATPGINRAFLTWQAGPPSLRYVLFRSTDLAQPFVAVATVPAPGLTDKPLVPFSTYYYKIAALNQGGQLGLLSSPISVLPFNIAPQEPFGFITTPSSTSVTLRWSTTTRFADGTVFESTSSPSVHELIGYRIYRSTNICEPSFAFLSSATVFQTEFSTYTGGSAYYYQIQSFNSLGPSTSTVVLSSLGDQHFFLPDCASELVMSLEEAKILSASSNTLGGDILISRGLRPQDTGGAVIQSAEFRVLLNGVTELKNFYLPKPARVTLHFQAVGGVPVPQGAGLAAAGPAAGASVNNLGMYWHNGAEYKKLYGKVDALTQTVTVETPNPGLYQIRTLFRSEGAVFDLSNVSSKVITPNDDGLNDVLIFTYDPGPSNIQPAGRVYDLRGAFVANMAPGLVPNTLVWDGKMNGRAVASGVYVYQIEGEGKTFNGTVVATR